MNRFLMFALALTISAQAIGENVTDNYTHGDTLTAEMMNNIKTAINSKQDRVAGVCSMGKVITGINDDGSVQCLTGGEGSRIDADTIDGMDSSHFAGSGQVCTSGNMIGIDDAGKIICSEQVFFYVQYHNNVAGGVVLEVDGDDHSLNFNPGMVRFNMGEGFNPSTGVFTAPVAGIYLFSGKIDIQPNGRREVTGPEDAEMHIWLTAGATRYQFTKYNIRENPGIHYTFSVVVSLNAGEEVFLAYTFTEDPGYGGRLFGDSTSYYCDSCFTGTLITSRTMSVQANSE